MGKRSRHFTTDRGWQVSIWKGAPCTSLSLGKHRSPVIRETQINTRHHHIPMEWPRFGTWTHILPSAGRIWSQRYANSLLVGMEISTITLEDGLVVSYKSKHTLTIWSRIHTPWYITLEHITLKGVETYVHTETCTPMFLAVLSIIAKIWKQPSCLLSRWMDIQW